MNLNKNLEPSIFLRRGTDIFALLLSLFQILGAFLFHLPLLLGAEFLLLRLRFLLGAADILLLQLRLLLGAKCDIRFR